MFDPRRMIAGVAFAGVLCFAGCAKEPKRAEVDPEATTPTVSEQEREGTEAPSDIAPTTAKLRVSDLKVGTRFDASTGAVAENLDEVLPGEQIHASIAVGDVGAGSQVKAVWLGPDDQRIAEDTKGVPEGVSFLIFNAPDTTAWTPGDYKVEIYLGDELASSESFDIIEKRAVG